jgi:hypothetical protein
MQKRLPTIIALVVILLGTAAGIFLIQRYRPLVSRANPTLTPAQIEVTNIQTNSFTVSWTTTNATSGFLNYGDTSEVPLTAKDPRDTTLGEGKYQTHWIPISGLDPLRTYYFIINSGGQKFDNSDSPYQITTAPHIDQAQEPDLAHGKIFNSQNQPITGALIYLRSPQIFSPQSALTDQQGQWSINLSSARSPDLSQYANYHLQTQELSFSVRGPDQLTALALTTTGNDSPVPDIKIGQNLSYDWRSLPPQDTNDSQETKLTSQFDFFLPAQALEPGSGNLALFNPQQAAPNATVTITIDPGIDQASTTTDQRGNWLWSPTTPLTAGIHTLTLTSQDNQGQPTTLTQSFTILAEDDLPAFTSSPGASLTPSPPTPTLSLPTTTITPELTPTLAPTSTPTQAPTASPATPTSFETTPIPTPEPPEAGFFLPTIILTGASLILIGSGLLLAL